MKASQGTNQRHAGGDNTERDARGQKASLHPRGVHLRLPLTDAERRVQGRGKTQGMGERASARTADVGAVPE